MTPRPNTVAEAVLMTLRDFALSWRHKADDILASRALFERSLADCSPEAIVLGGQKAIENERYCPSVSTLRKYATDEHHRILRATTGAIPIRRDRDDLRCHVCGAVAVWSNNRYQIEHDRLAHGVPVYE